MIEPPRAPGPNERCSTCQEASEESVRKKTVRERYMEEIAKNPRWRDTTKPGRGVVIGGAKVPSKR
jgi:hypothetical protein